MSSEAAFHHHATPQMPGRYTRLFATPIAPPHRPADRILASSALVLIPFPVSSPLLLWLTGRRHFSDNPDLPPPHHDRTS